MIKQCLKSDETHFRELEIPQKCICLRPQPRYLALPAAATAAPYTSHTQTFLCCWLQEDPTTSGRQGAASNPWAVKQGAAHAGVGVSFSSAVGGKHLLAVSRCPLIQYMPSSNELNGFRVWSGKVKVRRWVQTPASTLPDFGHVLKERELGGTLGCLVCAPTRDPARSAWM